MAPALLHASTIAKPQKSFPDTIDNSISRGAWVPVLTDKPHAMVPLDFVIPVEPEAPPPEDEIERKHHYLRLERDAKARQHPYYYESKHLPYPTNMFVSSPPIQPKSFDETPFVFVDTLEKLEAMVEKLKIAREIAVDLEHHSMRSYDGFTCLMQISTRDGDWVVDTLTLRGPLREGKLGGVMADPSIVKVWPRLNSTDGRCYTVPTLIYSGYKEISKSLSSTCSTPITPRKC